MPGTPSCSRAAGACHGMSVAGSQLGSSRRLPARPRPLHQRVLCPGCLLRLLHRSRRRLTLPSGQPVGLAASARRAVPPACLALWARGRTQNAGGAMWFSDLPLRLRVLPRALPRVPPRNRKWWSPRPL
eukprot:5228786-Alexandrium_andersonii.AAC.1